MLLNSSATDNTAFETINSDENFTESNFILGKRYKVLQKIGTGSFSQVLLARDLNHPKKRLVALKILHNKYNRQAITEIIRLRQLSIFNDEKNFQIVQIFDTFNFGSYICIVLEWLSGGPLSIAHAVNSNLTNPLHLSRESELRRLSVTRRISCQLVTSLLLLSKLGILHADLKPDNILHSQANSLDIKMLDFGNSIGVSELPYYYDTYNVQAMNYRAPEVLFGIPFGLPIDMWSLGCILCETWMGRTLFASITRSEMMNEMSLLFGKFPQEIFKKGKYCEEKFLKPTQDDADIKFHIAQSIANLLKTTDVNFLDFISGLLLYDPSKRLTPGMAIHHPFIADMVHLDSFSDKLYPFLLPLNDVQWNPSRIPTGIHEQSNKYSQGNSSTSMVDTQQKKRSNEYEDEEHKKMPIKKRQLSRD